MTKKLTLLLILAVAAAGSLAACGGAGSSARRSSASAVEPTTNSPSRVLTVTARDFGFAPDVLTAKAGKVTIRLRNAGKDVHEFIVLKTHDAPSKLPVHGGRVSEKDSVGEVSETPAGATRTATLTLKRGTYVIACNVPGHYRMGMHGMLKVV